jgi:hypothetical protein
MATTIRSSALDFNNIKNNLKTYFASKSEFTDYNFEASGLSNLLDVLAYNTHLNALIANFALNESYLGTAQLRSSIVSIAEGLGYIPDTTTASQAVVNITFTSDAVGRPNSVILPAGTQFTSSVDDITYTFQTTENYTATDDGTGNYQFLNDNGSNELVLYEGTRKVKTFYVGETVDNPVYIIPDKFLDADTVSVEVFPSATAIDGQVTYENILNARTISANSTIYIMKEAPNEFFELSFGDGVTFGVAPQAGNKIVFTYISTNGAVANSATLFTPVANFTSGSIDSEMVVTTVTASVGGDTKENIESIRQNAPFQYSAQNRMVTAADYSALILRNFSTLIRDIKAWGGEDNILPDFGAVYVSILFEEDVTAETQTSVKRQIVDLSDQLAIISFRLEFTDPVITYIVSDVFFQFNPNLTTLTLNTVTSSINQIIAQYFEDATGGFEESFRRSNMLTRVDEFSPAVLSSRANIRMQQRITPNLFAINNFNLRFPVSIAVPDDREYIFSSSSFNYNNQVCGLRNRLNSNVLEVFNITTQAVVVDNVGSYNPADGTVSIVGFEPSSIIGGDTFIKVNCIPANQSAISPIRNDVLDFDADLSSASGVIVTAQN